MEAFYATTELRSCNRDHMTFTKLKMFTISPIYCLNSRSIAKVFQKKSYEMTSSQKIKIQLYFTSRLKGR